MGGGGCYILSHDFRNYAVHLMYSLLHSFLTDKNCTGCILYFILIFKAKESENHTSVWLSLTAHAKQFADYSLIKIVQVTVLLVAHLLNQSKIVIIHSAVDSGKTVSGVSGIACCLVDARQQLLCHLSSTQNNLTCF